MNKIKQKFKNIKEKLVHKNSKFKKVKYVSILKKDNENITKFKPLSPLSQQIKIRNPGIDLGRILAMLGIIIHHILLFGNALNKYGKYKALEKINIAVFWHVSTYIFISGYVGYKFAKYSNLLYLWFWVLFYSLGIKIFFLNLNLIYIIKKLN